MDVREGNGNPLQYSCLENPMDGGAWQAAVHGVTRSQTQLSYFTFTFMHWRRKWQPTPVFLPRESQGPGSLVGCHLWGHTVGHDWSDLEAAACMDVRVRLWRKLSTKELMLLNCGVGEDSWESLGLQGYPTCPSQRKSVLNIHWNDWCWRWNSNTLATWLEEMTHLKSPWCWERLRAGGEGDDRGWDGWMASPTQWTWIRIGGTPGIGDGQGAWRAVIHGVTKSQTRLSDWSELNWKAQWIKLYFTS